jgi:oligoribonuclease
MSTTPEPLPLLAWVDMEMTGLDPARCVVLEVAAIITDGDLTEVATFDSLVIHHPDDVLDAMDAWPKEHHAKSGLTAASQRSKVDTAAAEEALLAFLVAYTKPGEPPLCGNSVHVDRAFLRHHLPRVEAHFHYRNIDVSTIKELVKRWYPAVPMFQKQQTHRALDDIRESLAELRYYRERVFLPPPPAT